LHIRVNEKFYLYAMAKSKDNRRQFLKKRFTSNPRTWIISTSFYS